MKISRLKNIIGEGSYLSNLWKKDGEGIICLSVMKWDENSLSRSYNTVNIEMDYDGKVLCFVFKDGVDQKEYEKLKNIRGSKIDLSSFEHDYQLDIKDSIIGVGSYKLLGRVNREGKACIFKGSDWLEFDFKKQYLGNNETLKDYGNHELIKVFKEITSSFKENLVKANCHVDGINYFYYKFSFNKFNVDVRFNRFFNYDLSVRVYHKGSEEEVLKLNGDDCLKVKGIINSLEKGELTAEIKEISALSNVECIKESFKEGDTYSLKIDGLSRKYKVSIDLKRNKVKVLNKIGNSKKVPLVVNNIEENLRNFDI